jgi:Pentapeptide repeats (8 copies)
MEQSKLNQILDKHKLWLETNGAEGKRANLTGANLTGANLEGANLSGANLCAANLYDANLSGANLRGANLEDANLACANLGGANHLDANLSGANLRGANLSGAIGLPYVYWIIPGCLAQLNQFAYRFYLEKERKYENFIQESLGFFIQDNLEEKTFDILAGDRIIRGIPDWVKYSGLKQIESV